MNAKLYIGNQWSIGDITKVFERKLGCDIMINVSGDDVGGCRLRLTIDGHKLNISVKFNIPTPFGTSTVLIATPSIGVSALFAEMARVFGGFLSAEDSNANERMVEGMMFFKKTNVGIDQYL
jgi:hypothetical protein